MIKNATAEKAKIKNKAGGDSDKSQMMQWLLIEVQ